jgi:hypothetical protein
MKLIEALKQQKSLARKADDLRRKVTKHSAISSIETPVYENQASIVAGWIQAHDDILKETLRLRLAIQRTNLETMVTIELGGKQVEKSIAAWIHRRRDLAASAQTMWKSLTDRRIQEGMTKTPSGDNLKIEIVRFYDPETRDKNISLYSEEPSLIDAKLEIVNAVTDLIE